MTQLMKTLVEKLQDLPEEAQEEFAASFLDQLEAEKEGEVEPYAALKILRDAKLPGPTDASVSYEKELYGRDVDDE